MLKKAIYKVDIELDATAHDNAESNPTNMDIANWIHRMLYDKTDRYDVQIHTSVVGPIEDA